MALPISEREVLFFLVILLTIAAYGLYRRLKPSAPKNHKRFIVAALIGGFGATIVHNLTQSQWNIGFQMWLLFSGLSYGIYRLVQRAREQRRKWLAVLIVAVLSTTVLRYSYLAYREVTATPPYCNKRNVGMVWSPIPPAPSILGYFFPIKVYTRCVPKPEEQQSKESKASK